MSEILLEYLLCRIDAALQAIYRRYFLDHSPPPPEMPHAERIAMLDAVKDTAWTLLDQVDFQAMADWFGVDRGRDHCLVRLSTLGLPPCNVVIVMSHHCSAACPHGCNHSGPWREDTRCSVEKMTNVVTQMSSLHIDRLNLTGGEPFLHRENLLECVRFARDTGIGSVKILTNGFWAAGRAQTMEILLRLQDSDPEGPTGSQ